jgi:MoxR-like ATPase
MLEAMNEASVSVDGDTLMLEPPFMVIATQNPYEFEGTYPLPENQLDRFLMRTNLGYPEAEDEIRVLELRPALNAMNDLKPALTRDELLALQSAVDGVNVDRALLDYIVRFAAATREHDSIRMGLSPRGSLALAQAARARAVYEGRDYVIPEDITVNIPAVCTHRVLTKSHLVNGSARTAERALIDVLEQIDAPA